MKITLTQENIRQALALFLQSRGVSTSKQNLDVEFIITRKGGTNVSAEVTVPDFDSAAEAAEKSYEAYQQSNTARRNADVDLGLLQEPVDEKDDSDQPDQKEDEAAKPKTKKEIREDVGNLSKAVDGEATINSVSERGQPELEQVTDKPEDVPTEKNETTGASLFG